MPLPKTVIEAVSIVLVGSFNPAIFHPTWFAAQGLITEEEADHAKLELVHPEVAEFSAEWLNVQVLRERFIASAVQSPSVDVLRDFVIGTFSILQHTPVTMLGLNCDRHFEMNSEDDWHAIGRRLAPPDVWKQVLEEPGMRSLTMQGVRTDGLAGKVGVKVEPSAQVKFGVYVNVNDHYDIKSEQGEVASAAAAIRIIRDRWSAFLEKPDTIANAIFGATG